MSLQTGVLGQTTPLRGLDVAGPRTSYVRKATAVGDGDSSASASFLLVSWRVAVVLDPFPRVWCSGVLYKALSLPALSLPLLEMNVALAQTHTDISGYGARQLGPPNYAGPAP